ncbi:diadenylate cyclase [Kitasatospora gansuensis]
MSGHFIRQFMWGYQSHFRISTEVAMQSALEAIGFAGDPKVILVGFQVSGEHEFSICIEPEDGLYSPADLEGVREREAELYAGHSDRRMHYSDARSHNLRHQELRDRMRAKALEEAFSTIPTEGGRSIFSGGSIRVGDYDVHIVVSVDGGTLDRVPKIFTEERDRFAIQRSLVHAVINEVIRRATRSLHLPDAGSGLLVTGASTDEIVRSATEALLRSAMNCAGFWFGSENHLLMSSISALPYEGRSGSGRLIIAERSHPAIEVLLNFRRPVKMRNVPAVRKLLEASGPEADLLTDGESVYGLGKIAHEYAVASETVFVVSVTNRGVWELSHGGEVLLTVRDGIPHLPTSVLDLEYFRDLVDRLFSDADVTILSNLARAAGEHRHGAMLIISGDAAGESERLSPQAWAIEPVELSPQLLNQLTDMDGAVLIDPHGRCHAVGVILDGVAHGIGDPARGSRFNNAVRYLDTDPPATIVIAYSADGGVDILPRLNSRIDRTVVDSAVNRYLAASATNPVDTAAAGQAWDLVSSLRFYLSAIQCEALNRARAAVDAWEEKHLSIRIVRGDVHPDPRMNDSYWI